jgi:hypothetical protein
VSRHHFTREQLRENMRRNSCESRATADEMASMYDGCDDPLWPFMLAGPDKPFRDWIDFTDRVCRPIVEAEDDEATLQAAMALYRKANPHFIATCMVMAANRARDYEADLRVCPLTGDVIDRNGAVIQSVAPFDPANPKVGDRFSWDGWTQTAVVMAVGCDAVRWRREAESHDRGALASLATFAEHATSPPLKTTVPGDSRADEVLER